MTSQLRIALRSLLKTPAFSLTAVATLALCLGANLAIYAVIDAVLVKGLPFPEAERLVLVLNSYPKADVVRAGASVSNYYDRRGQIPAFSAIALFNDGDAIVGDGTSPVRIPLGRVSPEFFETLGVKFAMGQSFTDDQMLYSTDQVAVLTDRFWRSHFNADPNVIGRTFQNDGIAVTVVGVLSPDFHFLSSRAEFYRPASHDIKDRGPDRRHNNSWQMLARLAPGATLAVAQSQLAALNERVNASDPFGEIVRGAGYTTNVLPLHADHVREFRSMLILIQAGVGFLLVIGVVNIANLMLIRASGRTRDLAIRQALGAARRHVAGEVLAESLILTLIGALAGLLLGSLGIDLLRTLGADQLPLGAGIAFNGRVAAFSVAAAVAIGVLLSLPIIWFNLHSRIAAALQTETRSGTTTRHAQRLRNVFIILQISLAFVLLSEAGLLGISLHRLLRTPPGFATENVLSGRIALPWINYKETAPRLVFAERLLDSLAALPGVTAASVSTGLPFTSQANDAAVAPEGYVPSVDLPLRAHFLSQVSADYFKALRIPLLKGRLLEQADSHRDAKVCVVDQAFAERYWPGQDPLGRRLAQGAPPITDENAFTVVGVVPEVKQAELSERAGHGAVYFPLRGASNFSVIVRTSVPPEALAGAVRAAVQAIDPGLTIDDLRPMQSRIDDTLLARRSPAVLAGVFAGVALLLASIGTYGVLAYAVGQRQREIGVRMALGALPRQVSAQFLGLGLRLLLVGVGFGVIGAWLAGYGLQSLLFGVHTMDFRVLVATATVLAAVVLFALWVPARRAARIDPLEALRSD